MISPIIAFLTGLGLGLTAGAIFWRWRYDSLLDRAKAHLETVKAFHDARS